MALANPTLKTGIKIADLNEYLKTGKHRDDLLLQHLGFITKDDQQADVWYCPKLNEIVVFNG